MNSVCQRAWAVVFVAAVLISTAGTAGAQAPPGDAAAAAGPTLVEAVVCEAVDNLAPRNPAVAFSLERGEVACFTVFDPVPEPTSIYHQWIFRDRPSARMRLRLRPPRWSTFSRIQLRPGDVGPWRVEVLDAEGRRMAVLRFSVVD